MQREPGGLSAANLESDEPAIEPGVPSAEFSVQALMTDADRMWDVLQRDKESLGLSRRRA